MPSGDEPSVKASEAKRLVAALNPFSAAMPKNPTTNMAKATGIRRINSAKRAETKQRRLDRMLGELRAGHGYMGMAWSPKS